MCKFNCLCPCVAVPVTAKEGEGEPSSQVKGVWDSVVSWMKMAVDFIALDSTTESLPGGAPHGKASKAGGMKHLIGKDFHNNSLDVSFLNLENQTLEIF